ncbi:MAG TPA: Gfo/Idh/MocA family oxidoreductase, partial [Saprospiraceae bacterium]|nr:Gfo/Idh/MocA family oxidoreductase [Saprospiraceae bacterium]
RMMQVVPTEVVALCDVNRQALSEAARLVKDKGNAYEPKQYTDYRKMLAEQQVDVMIIGTPDHWHALMAIDAMQSGAHVYLQKPISVDVLEGEAIVKIAQKTGRKVQVGLQRRSTPHVLQAKKEVLDGGLLGQISHVEMCCYYHMRDQRRLDPQPVPEYLDWDMYCGPAPLKTYDGIGWRAFMEFGNGIMGDMCVHMYDTARWLLDLGWPKKVSSTGGIFVQKSANANITDTQTAIFEHENINCVWTHRTWGTAPDPEYPWGLFIYGEHGTLKVSTMKCDFIPHDKSKNSIRYDVLYERSEFPSDLTEPRIELHAAPATRAHFTNLITSIEQNLTPVASIVDTHISTASCILANNAMVLERPLVYDPSKKIVIADDEATRMLKREYRAPWKHPFSV